YLGQLGTDGAHAVGDDIHGTAFHAAVKKFSQFGIHDLRVFPVVGGTCIFFFSGADEGSSLHPGHVVDRCSVQQAAGQLLFVKPLHFAGGNRLIPQLAELLLASVQPDDLVRFCQGRHLVDPVKNILVFCKHCPISFRRLLWQSDISKSSTSTIINGMSRVFKKILLHSYQIFKTETNYTPFTPEIWSIGRLAQAFNAISATCPARNSW